MAKQAPCPAQQELQALATGKVPAATMEAFVAHLEICPDCPAKIDPLLSQSDLALLLRKGPTKAPVTIDAAMAGVMDRLQQLSRPGSAATQSGKVNNPAVSASDSSPLMGIPVDDVNPEWISFLEPPQEPDELGRLGQYRALRILGSGGMGVVFHAEDTFLKRQVALKAIKPNSTGGNVTRQRFLREAQAAAKVVHENVVTLHQAGEVNGIAFLAMEYLQGEELEDRLERDHILPLPELLHIGRQIALGLAAANAQGLIHRDIKPANVFLVAGKGTSGPSSLPRVKILDFGLARALEDNAKITQSGMVVGTPSFMAPEQATGKTLDHRCDLFSLGVVLYRMATGTLPFTGANAMAVLLALAQEEPTPPQMINFDVPGELNELILRLLAKKPEDRPVTAQAVAEELAALEKHLLDPEATVVERKQTAAATPTAGPEEAGEFDPQPTKKDSPKANRGCLGMILAAALLIGVGVAGAMALFG